MYNRDFTFENLQGLNNPLLSRVQLVKQDALDGVVVKSVESNFDPTRVNLHDEVRIEETFYPLANYDYKFPKDVDSSRIISDIIDRAIAIGKSGKLATINNVYTDLTPSGQLRTVLEVEGTDMFFAKEEVALATFDYVENGDQSGYDTVFYAKYPILVRSPNKLYLPERDMAVQPGDEIYVPNHGFGLASLSSVFNFLPGKSGAYLNVPDRQSLNSLLQRFCSDEKIIYGHPTTLASLEDNAYTVDKSKEITVPNRFLPKNELYVLYPKDFKFVFLPGPIVDEPADFSIRVMWGMQFVCTNPQAQLCLHLNF